MSNKKVRPKVRHKKDVLDEWEIADIDRDEQRLGLERRARRWREIEMELIRQKQLEKTAVKNAEKMNIPRNRPPNELEEAWIRCDYVLYNMMEEDAYMVMEWLRLHDPDAYKFLYRKFVSKYMMENIMYYMDYFAAGNEAKYKIPKSHVMKFYKQYYNIKNKITIKRKGKEDREL